jgi:hypothetical protein
LNNSGRFLVNFKSELLSGLLRNDPIIYDYFMHFILS